MLKTTTHEYSISELAKELGIKPRTIHFYIKEGIIEPACRKGGRAKYSPSHLLRLQFLEHLQKSGVKLYRIKEILGSSSDSEIENQLVQAIAGDLYVATTAGKKRIKVSREEIKLFLEEDKQPELKIDEETWKRIRIIDGVEVMLRGDLPKEVRKRMKEFISYVTNDLTGKYPPSS